MSLQSKKILSIIWASLVILSSGYLFLDGVYRIVIGEYGFDFNMAMTVVWGSMTYHFGKVLYAQYAQQIKKSMVFQKDDRVQVYVGHEYVLGVVSGYSDGQLYLKLDDGRLASYPKAEPFMVNAGAVSVSHEPYPLFPQQQSAWRERKLMKRINSGNRS